MQYMNNTAIRHLLAVVFLAMPVLQDCLYRMKRNHTGLYIFQTNVHNSLKNTMYAWFIVAAEQLLQIKTDLCSQKKKNRIKVISTRFVMQSSKAYNDEKITWTFKRIGLYILNSL